MIPKQMIDIIKEFEGCRLDAYQDSVGVWTIGYGHTKGVSKGLKITQAEAETMLVEELENEYIPAVKGLVKVPLNDNELSALVSFTYNLGAGNLKKSTLLRLLNQGDRKGASMQFGSWVRAGGKVLNGLVRRREAERNLFLKP